jgi:probable rRNA maturation factor
MSGEFSVQNRQRTFAIDLRLLRRITNTVLTELLAVEQFELGIHLVATPEMTQLNETFLGHSGSTDVITFNYSDPATCHPPPASTLHGEIFISIDEAVAQSRSFRSTWQSELVRYLVHGLLHLLGHDDAQPAARRKMKREEQRLLCELARRFPLSKLSRKTKVAA